MRRPQASFEAQPRIARLLAPKMGIDPYRQVGKCIRIYPEFLKKHCIQWADRVVRPYAKNPHNKSNRR